MTAHSNHQPNPSDDWQRASGGEIVRLTHRMKGRKTRRQFLQASGIVGGLLTLAGSWWLLRRTTSKREYTFGGITCSEVATRTDDLMQGRLPADEAAKVKQHFIQCPNCKPKFDRMGGMKTFGQAAPVYRGPNMA